MRTLVIGDVHGRVNRLEALLLQEGILEKKLDSSSIVRVNHDDAVIQLGDLGHYGYKTQAQDRDTWELAPDWLDTILLGNHDAAVFDPQHSFGGYLEPFPETVYLMKQAKKSGKLQLAAEAHGFLLTHAGLHPHWYRGMDDPHLKSMDAKECAEWLNEENAKEGQWSTRFCEIRDNVDPMRGGSHRVGGILWRDARQKLYEGYRQIFGHTSKDTVCRTYNESQSYCIDVGDISNGRLMGMWLPSEEVVEVNLKET